MPDSKKFDKWFAFNSFLRSSLHIKSFLKDILKKLISLLHHRFQFYLCNFSSTSHTWLLVDRKLCLWWCLSWQPKPGTGIVLDYDIEGGNKLFVFKIWQIENLCHDHWPKFGTKCLVFVFISWFCCIQFWCSTWLEMIWFFYKKKILIFCSHLVVGGRHFSID